MRTRVLKTTFAVAGLVFLVFAFLESWDRSQGLPIVAWPRLALAAVAVLASLSAGLRGWSILLERPPMVLAPGFLTSQLGKYVPGGVWQAVGQVGYATGSETTVQRASVAFLAFAVVQAVSGAAVGAFLALTPGPLPLWVRLGAGAGLLTVVVLRRGWLVRAVALAGRLRGNQSVSADLVPSQPAMLRAALWGGVSLIAMAIGFLATLTGSIPITAWPTVVLAFVVAWTVGFLAVPVPAGVGIREGVLLLTVGHVAGASAIVAASVTLRLVAIGCELAAIGAVRLRRVAAEPDGAAPQPDDHTVEPDPAADA